MMVRIAWDMPRRHPWATRIGLALAFAVALGYGPHRAVGGADARIDTLARQLDETRDAIAATERENAELRARVRALKNDPEAIEEIARRDLGLVRPGEVVVDLRGALGRAPAGAEAAEAP
jgi:cell division protein FtsB